jgi:nucleoside diphosphate kinase
MFVSNEFEIVKQKKILLSSSQSKKINLEHLANQSVYALQVSCKGDDATERVNKLLTSFRDRTGTSVSASCSSYDARRDSVALFGDDQERSYACCIIKPDATVSKTVTVNEGTRIVEKEVRPWEEIKRTIESEDLVIVGELEVTLTKEDMIELYPEECESEMFKEQLVPHMTSGKSLILAVEGTSAVERLQVLMGPINAEQARSIAPCTIRARFGKDDDVENAVSGSSSEASAKREIEKFFPRGFKIQQTLAMIKPDAVRAGHVHSILARIRAEGFTVIQQQKVRLTRERAETFYAEHQGRFFFDNLVSKMSSDFVYAMVLAKPGAIKHWRQLLGPTNVSRARQEKPNSIRAIYGKDGTSNAAHGSDSECSADRELSFFFPRVSRRHYVDATKAQKYLSSKKNLAGLKRSLNATVIEGCVELCKVKPQGLNAVRWLGRWFLEQSRKSKTKTERVSSTCTSSSSSSSSSVSSSSNDGKIVNAKIYNDVSKSDVVFVLGEPGSGAHIVCERLSKSFGYEVLKTDSNSDTSEESRVKFLLDAMKKSPRRKFVVEGFPKTLSEAFAFEQSICECKVLIHVDVSEATIANRLQDFGVTNSDQIKRRLTKIRDQSHQLVNFYKKLGRAIRIDGNDDLDSAWAQVAVNFQKQVLFVVGSSSCVRKKIGNRVVGDFGYVFFFFSFSLHFTLSLNKCDILID